MSRCTAQGYSEDVGHKVVSELVLRQTHMVLALGNVLPIGSKVEALAQHAATAQRHTEEHLKTLEEKHDVVASQTQDYLKQQFWNQLGLNKKQAEQFE